MPKCYIFGIGGTGSRVLRSLTHLLAAGLRPRHDFTIVPIIIDPHSDNEDLKRAKTLLENYKKVRAKTYDEVAPGFFSTAIQTLEGEDSFAFELDDTKVTFRKYIGYEAMDAENRALAEMLFSGKSKNNRGDPCELLDVNMEIGFVGNPNVGSVVLNEVKESKAYKTFANEYTEDGNRIFIISSIFGGTGAAGFPNLLKNIRNSMGERGDQNVECLKRAKIGALTVMPYFNLKDSSGSAIDYSEFIAKTKSALHYYEKSVNQSVNVMYYVGDRPGEPYENDPGYGGQKNDAHFVELAGALAVIDFLSQDDDSRCFGFKADGTLSEPICKKFSIRNNVPRPNFFDFCDYHQKLLSKPLSQFALFKKYMEEEFKKTAAGGGGWRGGREVLTRDFVEPGTFYANYLQPVFKDFAAWLEELGKNNRGFSPFNTEVTGDQLGRFINGITLEKKLFSGSSVEYNDFEKELNALARDKEFGSSEKKLLNIFYAATGKIVTDPKKYNLGRGA